jgi:large subunit ribosomal protein L25
MERVELKAQSRSLTGKKVEQLRRQNLIPAVVYGPDTPAKSIQIEERALTKALHEAGSTALIDLHIDDKGKPNVVLARDIQRDILTSRFQHFPSSRDRGPITAGQVGSRRAGSDSEPYRSGMLAH